MKKMVSVIIAMVMIIGALPARAEVVDTPLYGDELFTVTDFENSSVGKMNNPWPVYHSYDVAYGECISKVNNPEYADYIHSGNKAARFINANNMPYGQPRGLYYKASGNLLPDTTPGTVYEFSGWFTTESTESPEIIVANGALAGMAGSTAFCDDASATLQKGVWTNVKFKFTVPENGAVGIRLVTRLSTPRKISDYNNVSSVESEKIEAMRADLIADGQTFIYVDDVSLRMCTEAWSEDTEIETTSNESNALARVSYKYFGVEEEGASTVEYQINSSNTDSGWETYKVCENVTEDTADEASVIMLDSSCAGKYLRAVTTVKTESGKIGKKSTSEVIEIAKASNLVPNPSFKWGVYGWTGDIDHNSDETAAVYGDASIDCNYALSAETRFTVKFTASGFGTLKAYVNDTLMGEAALTNDATEYSFNGAIPAADEVALRLVVDDGEAIVDDISITPQAPQVYQVGIIGKGANGEKMEASYVYDGSTDDNIPEGNTTIEWFMGRNGSYSKVGEGRYYTLPQTNCTGELYITVTPVNRDGVSGSAVNSDKVSCYTVSAENLRIEATGNKTNSILKPSYTYRGTAAEGDSKLEWIQADSPDAPDDAWEPIETLNSVVGRRGIPASTVKASTIASKGWLPLNQESRGKYVAFRITPVDEQRREGVPVRSEATPMIEFEKNLINNGDFS